MSFFSRVRVNACALTKEDLKVAMAGETYLDHRLVWKLFPGDDMKRDFVFRSERDVNNALLYYIVSDRKPINSAPKLFKIDLKEFSPRLTVGERIHFDVRANPTVAVRQSDRKRSGRHDVLMHAKRLAREKNSAEIAIAMDTAGIEWLIKRAADWGLSISKNSVSMDSYVQHRLLHRGRRIEFSSADYQGLARVDAPEKLHAALLEGVGRSKAFGCGLLLVRRI